VSEPDGLDLIVAVIAILLAAATLAWSYGWLDDEIINRPTNTLTPIEEP
jgi:hypothetical protein